MCQSGLGDSLPWTKQPSALRSAEILGVIGANGAGKTTIIDAITGFVPLSAGQILLDGKDLSQMDPTKRARSGISRSFPVTGAL